MKRFMLAILVVVAVAASVLVVLNHPGAEASTGATITVNSVADNNLRDDVLTLREAMLLATGDLAVGTLDSGECGQVSNTTYGPPCSTTDTIGAASGDTIDFASLVSPVALIALGSALPILDEGDDTIDASSSSTRWVVDGEDSRCFPITSDNNTIKGLEIYDCYTAVEIWSGHDNTIGGSGPGEGNVISGNHWSGVFIYGAGTDGNVVKGNYIGIDPAGDAALPNQNGVEIWGGAQNNIIGGRGPGDGNVISGNEHLGVSICHSGSNGNVVKGNYIGTNASGTVAIPNGLGVLIRAGPQDNTIGGTGAGEGNLIAFNDEYGVVVSGEYLPPAPPTGNTIRGNSIHSNGGEGIELVEGGNTELEPPIVESVGSVFGTACSNCTIDIYSDDEDEGRVYEGSTTADGDGNWSFSGTPEGPNITATATDSDGNTSEFSAPLEPPWPTPTSTAAPTPSPTPGVTPTPVGPTRTLVWGPGWHNVIWSGASTPQEAFSCAAGNYAAAYRLVSGGWERYFPDRPDLSNMTDLEQYDTFLILITDDVTCEMPVADPPDTGRTLEWGVGWQNDGWTGPDGTAPEDAFACADGSYAAAYRFTATGLERYFPDRPDISDMGPLNKYDAFLILVTAPVSCTMPVAP